MKTIQIFVVTILLVSLSFASSHARKEPYKVMLFKLVDVTRNVALEEEEKKAKLAAEEAKRNRYKQNKKNDESTPQTPPTNSNQIVEQKLRIISGKFNIRELSDNEMYSKYTEIRKYKNNLTRLKGDKWKIALPVSEITPENNQKIIQEILRQLNAVEEEKNSVYKEINVSGWKVRIQEDLMNDRVYKKRAIKELKRQLQNIRYRIPSRAVKQLREVPIWVYKNRPGVDKNVTAYYSSLYKAVVFHDAKKLHNLSDFQNAIVLHELAHGYHDIYLGYDNLEIIEAYENAVEKGLYKNVKMYNGHIAKEAYALTNHKEYFAELSEAYFASKNGSLENDYFPFNRNELRKYDKMGYKLAKSMWGK